MYRGMPLFFCVSKFNARCVRVLYYCKQGRISLCCFYRPIRRTTSAFYLLVFLSREGCDMRFVVRESTFYVSEIGVH